jgi:recombination protein RecA
VKIVKNKVAPPFKEVEVDILYNEGISKVGDMIDIATEQGIVNKTGSWYSYGEERVQGKEGLKKMMKENTELYIKLENEVKSKLFGS